MAVKQYVGARYVPKFAEPLEWQSGTSYEALTIVSYNNNSYTSKIPVPANVGNPVDNTDYWALTGNYNAQLNEVSSKIDSFTNYESKTLGTGYEQELSEFNSANGVSNIKSESNSNTFSVLSMNIAMAELFTDFPNSIRKMSELYNFLVSFGATFVCNQEYIQPDNVDYDILPTEVYSNNYFQETLRYGSLRYLKWGNNIKSTVSGSSSSALYNNIYNSWEYRGYINLKVNYKNKTISIYCTHLSSAETNTVRTAQLNELATVINNDSSAIIIVCGDFNFITNEELSNGNTIMSNAGLSAVNTGTLTWPRTAPVDPTDNIYYKGATLTEYKYISSVPSALSSMDHVGIFAKFTV